MRRFTLLTVLIAVLAAAAAVGPTTVVGTPPNSCPPGQVNGDYCQQTACKGVTQVGDNNPNVQNGTECDDTQIGNAIAAVWKGRTDRYSEIRSANTLRLPKVEMSYICG